MTEMVFHRRRLPAVFDSAAFNKLGPEACRGEHGSGSMQSGFNIKWMGLPVRHGPCPLQITDLRR